MCNNAFEDYKKAIKAKYEIEKEGEYSEHFNPPSQANLRDLCIKRFKSNTNTDDLNTFFSFFGFEFDTTKKNLIKEKDLDKFKPIGFFLTGKTKTPKKETICFSAILVDFKPRPFNKFRLKEVNQEIEEFDNSSISEPNKEEEKVEIFAKKKSENLMIKRNPIDLFSDSKDKFFRKLFRKTRGIMGGILIIFCLIVTIIYFAFIKKHCMQWSNDHYEIVDCNSEDVGNLNEVIPLDKNLLNFRKIEVCDTTSCFRENGEAIIWYSKSNNVVDFFNTHGRHPENNKALKAVTPYIFNKYKKRCLNEKIH